MAHGKKNNSGGDTAPAPTRSRISAREDSGVQQRDAKPGRRSGNSKGRSSVGSSFRFADGFLKCRFLPRMREMVNYPDHHQEEEELYQSFASLCKFYNIEPEFDTRPFGYPYNVQLALWQARKQLEGRDNVTIGISGSRFTRSEAAAVKPQTLYYVPVKPVDDMSRDRPKTWQIMLHVLAYLYQVADVPHYDDYGSYMNGIYSAIIEMQAENLDECQRNGEEEMNRESIEEFIELAQAADSIGTHMGIMMQQDDLEHFAVDLELFKPVDEFDQRCATVAAQALDLYTKYPEVSLFDSAGKFFTDSDYYEITDEGEVMFMGQYISFVSDTDETEWLYSELEGYVNGDLQECTTQEVPVGIEVVFPTDNDEGEVVMDHGNRILQLIDDLCEILNDYQSERKRTIQPEISAGDLRSKDAQI